LKLRYVFAGCIGLFLIFAWLGFVLASAGQHDSPDHAALMLQLQGTPVPNPCSTGETPCDPNRPWMRGTVEKYCGRRPSDIERMKKEHPLQADRIMQCDCQHTCDPFNEHAGATMGKAWDGRCQARCNPANCQCPDPCES
jgi:hypothetical protein